jgi:hypothetical protein
MIVLDFINTVCPKKLQTVVSQTDVMLSVCWVVGNISEECTSYNFRAELRG